MNQISPLPVINSNESLPKLQTHVNSGLRRRKLTGNSLNEQKTPSVSVIGLDKVYNSNINIFVRIIWFVVLLITIILCCLQLYNCLYRYFSNPVITQTSVIRSPTVQFPAIYICPPHFRNIQHVYFNMFNCNETNFRDCYGKNPYDKALFSFLPDLDELSSNVTISDVWDQIVIPKKEEFVLYEACRNENDTCSEFGRIMNITHTKISTFWGSCLILNTSRVEEFRGPFTYISINFYGSYYGQVMDILRSNLTTSNESRQQTAMSINKPTIGLMLSFHHDSSTTNRNHFVFSEIQEVYQGYETHIELQMQKFKLENRRQSPCYTEQEYINCINSCFEKLASDICKMPYIKAKGSSMCRNGSDTFTAHLHNHKSYATFNFSGCNCPKQCDETVFTGSHNVLDKTFDEKEMIIKFFYSDNVYEETTEKYTYPFDACLSDFGGSLGFFLGFCTLNVFEIIEFIAYNIAKHIK